MRDGNEQIGYADPCDGAGSGVDYTGDKVWENVCGNGAFHWPERI